MSFEEFWDRNEIRPLIVSERLRSDRKFLGRLLARIDVFYINIDLDNDKLKDFILNRFKDVGKFGNSTCRMF